jgi:hypothetical protein
VAVQLVFVREYLAQFQGNEIVIALIFFCWLVFGGIGTTVAKVCPGQGIAPIPGILACSPACWPFLPWVRCCHSPDAGHDFHPWRVGGVLPHLGICCRHPFPLCPAGGFRAAVQPAGRPAPVARISRQLDVYG